jgi:hypothetical protein
MLRRDAVRDGDRFIDRADNERERARICAASDADVVRSTTSESAPCSACARRSAMTNRASALSSAMTINSVGPAVMSIPTSPMSRIFAAVT